MGSQTTIKEHSEIHGTIVAGYGPRPSRLLICGERPGESEARYGRPFCGKSGQEQDRYLLRAGVSEGSYYKTNIVKDYADGNPDPQPWEIRRDTPLLAAELAEVRPEFIGAVGRFAARFFLGNVSMETAHGMSYWSNVPGLGWQGWVVPIYHPAAGLYNNDLQPTIAFDYRKLALYYKGKIELRQATDHHPQPLYLELTTPYEVESVLEGFVSVAEVVHPLPIRSHQRILATTLLAPLAIDTEGSRTVPWGLSFSWEPGAAYVIRYANRDAIRAVARFIEHYNPLVIFHNALHDLEVLRAMGITVRNFDDTMIRAYQLQVEPQGLKPLARRFAGMDQPSYPEIVADANAELAEQYLCRLYAESRWPDSLKRTEFDGGKLVLKRPWSLNRKLKRLMDDYAIGKVDAAGLRDRWDAWETADKLQAIAEFGDMPEATLDDVPLDRAIHYSARDADATIRIYPEMRALTDAIKLESSIASDLAALPMIERMQSRGIQVDVPKFAEVSNELLGSMLEVHNEVEGCLGKFVNLNSSQQLANFLYGDLHGIPDPPKFTEKGAPSLNEAGLATIKVDLEAHDRMTDDQALACWVIDKTLEYRELLKLRNTYAEKIPLYVRDGILHPTLRVTQVITGRLSATKPNVLALPTRSNLAKLIKQCFIARPGWRFGTADFSGIEMRVMAHLSQDPVLLENFRTGIDQHTRTASMIWGVPMDQVDKHTMRFPAKTMGFLIIYGGGPYTLQTNLKKQGLDWTVDRCEELIKLYLDIHAGVRRYMQQQIEYCRRYGLVRTMKGRIRHLPGIYSREKFIRLEAERAAINYPIQGTAQEIIKQAMADLWAYLPTLWDSGLLIEILLQIHDELFYEHGEGQWDQIDPTVRAVMEQCWKLDVPLEVSSARGATWADLDK